MNIKLSKIFENLSELSKLVHFDISLHGWAAAASIMTACAAAVAIKVIPSFSKGNDGLPDSETELLTDSNDCNND